MMYFLPMRHKETVSLKKEYREQLEKWIRSPTTPSRLVLRSRIVLLAAVNKHDIEISTALVISRHTSRLWRKRFIKEGVGGLMHDAKGRGRKATITDKKVKSIVDATLHSTPDNATHWSVRLMAKRQHVSPKTIHRIWQRYNLKPHLVETFKLSKDKKFFEKLEDVVGLYMNPPDKALVFCFPSSCSWGSSSTDARLYKAWNDHTVCCLEHARWNSYWRMHAASSPSGIHQVFEQA